jgi:hypothetical protein
MFSRQGPTDIDCDAPPYPIVRACQRLGFQSPLDVRWRRMKHFLKGRGGRGGVLGFHPWLWLFGGGQPPEAACACGQPLPPMELYTFTVASGKEAHYLLGQCCRCRTMLWDEAPVPSRKEGGWRW